MELRSEMSSMSNSTGTPASGIPSTTVSQEAIDGLNEANDALEEQAQELTARCSSLGDKNEDLRWVSHLYNRSSLPYKCNPI
jgi:hypothetical protein